MKYLGGKHKIARRIAGFLEDIRPSSRTPFFDVFTGGANIVSAMTGPRVANDICTPLITLYRSWLEGWRPPLEVSEDEWNWIWAVEDPHDPITAFAGFGLSYAGMYFGTFARDPSGGRNYAAETARGLERKMAKCVDVRFENVDFEELDIPDGALVYLDPPYRDTTGYAANDAFEHDRFDRWALELAERCLVVLSEYEAPDPWVEVASFDVFKSRFKGRQTERLYMVRR